MQAVYKRVLLKLSGEALAGEQSFGLDFDKLYEIGRNIKDCADMGVEIGVVVGGGNFWRGRQNSRMDQTRADHIGMMGTVMNALALADSLEQNGADVRVQTAIAMQSVAEPYIRNRAVRHLEKGRIVVFGCGTGNPFFSTDTAASLRAAEIDAEVILMAKTVDGVYDKDPRQHADATRYDELTFSEVLSRHLDVMDMTAASMCRDLKIPVAVFSLSDPTNIIKVISGDNIGTYLREA